MKASSTIDAREKKFMPATLEKVKLDGTFSGYASVFGIRDQGNDVVMRGAFAGSLKNRPLSSIRMLFQHDPDQPIGTWTKIQEDDKGLYVEGKITPGVKRGEEVLQLMRERAVDGLSIGFKTKRARVNSITKARHILALELWEISVVTFPLLEEARIDSVKSKQRKSKLPTIREFERWLTRDAGLSRQDARRVLTDGYQSLTCKRDAAWDKQSSLVDTIRKATSLFYTRN